MDTDLILAIAHHLAVFTLVGLFAAEFALVRPGLTGAAVGQLSRIDAAYGALAVIVIVVGIIRVIFGASGWEYYAGNHMFWGKMVAFGIMGALSVPPTLAIRRWSKALASEPGYAPPLADVTASRRFIHLQALFLLFVPAFAAAMARGYGIN